jgi:hypothetical protein
MVTVQVGASLNEVTRGNSKFRVSGGRSADFYWRMDRPASIDWNHPHS